MPCPDLVCRRLAGTLAVLCVLPLARPAAGQAATADLRQRLNRGEVVVDQEAQGKTTFVVAKILLDAPPDKVWPIVGNPFEFEGKISPRLKRVDVLTDRGDLSVLKMNVYVCFLFPELTYTVESRYDTDHRIDFRRVDGSLKDFRGFWAVEPCDQGRKTILTYSLYVDPGFPVPQWIIRQGEMGELPRTLIALRQRVQSVCTGRSCLESRSIQAAGGHPAPGEPRDARHS